MNYARAFRVIRAEAGISQAEFAARIGIDASMVSLIESGGRRPSTATIERTARAMRLPSHLLLLLAAETRDLNDVTETEMQRAARSLAEMFFTKPPGRRL